MHQGSVWVLCGGTMTGCGLGGQAEVSAEHARARLWVGAPGARREC